MIAIGCVSKVQDENASNTNGGQHLLPRLSGPVMFWVISENTRQVDFARPDLHGYEVKNKELHNG